MLEQLRCLIEFQLIENKKALLVKNADEIPKRIAEIERDFAQFEGEYLAKKAECEHSKEMHRSLEQNVADYQAKITRSKSRMGEVKTNKEYQAISKEIEETKKEISQREDTMLTLMETIESLSKELAELETVIESRKQKIAEDKEQLLRQNEELQGKLDKLEAIQSKVRERLSPDLLKRSEFLIQRQAGIAVAPVQNGVCQVCHMNIPPQKFIEIQRDETIHQCPHCHRYIYWPGHEGYCIPEDEAGDS
ncbi:MAG: zinc ribbon domain-containing protein [Acidobacteriota bacterium]